MASDRLIFRVHAVRRMFERSISLEDVRYVLDHGVIIERYPEDFPYPSRLVLGWSGTRPLHMVVADNFEARETIIVTVYEPDAEQWEPDFKRRKQ